MMNHIRSLDESRVKVLLSWHMLNGETVSEAEFLREIRQFPLDQLLSVLIRLLQYGDSNEPSAYRVLDSHIYALCSSETAIRITEELIQERSRIFFSQWQLLFAIKLVCTFGRRDAVGVQKTNDDFLNLLLMANDFYPRGEPAPVTPEVVFKNLKRTALRGYWAMQPETPWMLIGRYAEIFGRLAAPANQNDFKNWMDIQKILVDELGVQLNSFKAVLLALFGNYLGDSTHTDDGWALPQLGSLNPGDFFANTELPEGQVDRVLDLISTSPDKIKEDHHANYGNTIGNSVDLGFLLRNPAIILPGGHLVPISGQLLVQRYTCGLYWDIHDALPDAANVKPNRRQFQTFFGELHERYGHDTLKRIKSEQVSKGKKIRLLSEEDYASPDGSNPDSLVIESIGNRNTRCTLFEFKVGRPRYKDSIVEADLQAFEEDLSRKIEAGLDQEIDFCRKLQCGNRKIPGLVTGSITAWLFVIVVTDPYPSMGMFLESLRRKLANSSDLGKAKRYGPFVLSLMEIEQLEMLSNRRVSQSLIDWYNGPDREWPFNTFYANLRSGQQVMNRHVGKLADIDMETAKSTIFEAQPHSTYDVE